MEGSGLEQQKRFSTWVDKSVAPAKYTLNTMSFMMITCQLERRYTNPEKGAGATYRPSCAPDFDLCTVLISLSNDPGLFSILLQDEWNNLWFFLSRTAKILLLKWNFILRILDFMILWLHEYINLFLLLCRNFSWNILACFDLSLITVFFSGLQAKFIQYWKISLQGFLPRTETNPGPLG